MADGCLYDAKILLKDAADALSALTMLLCDYQDGLPLPAGGLRVMLLPVEDNVRQGLELVELSESHP